ncbi:MAG TPA: hypothetical protein VFS60_16695, partial [Thermoanaerobaculia bacterium]|nr:hypothetical protein [Thermoanaerobaculia bacterium]
YATFKTLAGLAKFDPRPSRTTAVAAAAEAPVEPPSSPRTHPEPPADTDTHRRRNDFHYNIQIHLPVTTDISVYNAIFKSLKENLGIH